MSAGEQLSPTQFSGWGDSTYVQTRKPENYAQRGKSNRAGYGDYLAEREAAATKATNGYMVSPSGKAKGYDSGSFFHPNSSMRPGRKHMTDELRSWMGDSNSPAEHGGNGGGLLSFASWHAQSNQKQEPAA